VTHTRTVEKCAEWVRNVAPDARWFIFRRESNWMCGVCPKTYRGTNPAGTHIALSWRISIYEFRPFNRASWLKTYKVV